MVMNMWKNSLKNVESDNNKILYEILLDFCSQRNGTYFLNEPRIMQKRCDFHDARYLMQEHSHTLIIFNTYCFSIATMVM